MTTIFSTSPTTYTTYNNTLKRDARPVPRLPSTYSGCSSFSSLDSQPIHEPNKTRWSSISFSEQALDHTYPKPTQATKRKAGSTPTHYSSFSSQGTQSTTYSDSIKSRNSVASFPEQVLDHSHLKPGRSASLLSYTETIDMYRESAKKTDSLEQEYEFAGFLYETAYKQHNDNDKRALLYKAKQVLKRLTVKKHANAEYQLAKMYANGEIGVPDLKKAFRLFLRASNHHHATASYRAAQCLEYGIGCLVNYPKAVQAYKKAASLSHSMSMVKLGRSIMKGELGLTVNPKEALKWYTRAVEARTAGYSQAFHELANMHVEGYDKIVYVDLNYAVRLYQKAADLGYGPSAFKMGECYQYGKLNCPQDAPLSIHYYTIAAEHGESEACLALSNWYLVGDPIVLPQSDKKAYIWAKMAANLGLATAQFNLGFFSEMGIGCTKNNAEATTWYTLAAQHGDTLAQKRIAKEEHVSFEQTKAKKRHSLDNCNIM